MYILFGGKMNPLKSIPMTVGLGFLLAVIISISFDHIGPDMPMWSLVTWLHVFFGIIWNQRPITLVKLFH